MSLFRVPQIWRSSDPDYKLSRGAVRSLRPFLLSTATVERRVQGAFFNVPLAGPRRIGLRRNTVSGKQRLFATS